MFVSQQNVAFQASHTRGPTCIAGHLPPQFTSQTAFSTRLLRQGGYELADTAGGAAIGLPAEGCGRFRCIFLLPPPPPWRLSVKFLHVRSPHYNLPCSTFHSLFSTS